ncbi:MAG TPA: hypothetical protein DDW30_07870 [Clostridiales bacterium]|nr:hypothetical protein [Clostridiales bacterium]
MKTRSTKKALIASLLSMLLCASMLIGSTFAWFTDTATTAVNRIQAGSLDVELWQGETDAKLNSEALKWVVQDGRDQDKILWEPGCSYDLESFRIKNNGNLALKYKVVINGLVGNAKLLEAIDFTVKVEGDALIAKDGTSTVATVADLNNFEGTLSAGAVTGKITITGIMKKDAGNEYQGLSIDGISITVVAAQDTVENDSNGNTYDRSATYPVTIRELLDTYGNDGIHMPAGVEITTAKDPEGTNGSLTTVTLKDYEAFVYFTQVFDHEKAYEARKALLSNEANKAYSFELHGADYNIWYTGYIHKLTVKMDCDIDLGNARVNPFLFADIGNTAFTFDGNGHTIKNAKLASSTGNVGFFGHGVSVKNVTLDNIHVTATGNPENQCAGIVSSDATANISGVTVKNSSVTGGKYTGAIVGYNYGSITNCTVENCTVSGQYKVGGIVGYICNSNNQDTYVTGNKLTDVTVKAENVLAGKTAVIGKIVGNWNATTGTCNNNTFSGTTVATDNIGKTESGCTVTR